MWLTFLSTSGVDFVFWFVDGSSCFDDKIWAAASAYKVPTVLLVVVFVLGIVVVVVAVVAADVVAALSVFAVVAVVVLDKEAGEAELEVGVVA